MTSIRLDNLFKSDETTSHQYPDSEKKTPHIPTVRSYMDKQQQQQQQQPLKTNILPQTYSSSPYLKEQNHYFPPAKVTKLRITMSQENHHPPRTPANGTKQFLPQPQPQTQRTANPSLYQPTQRHTIYQSTAHPVSSHQPTSNPAIAPICQVAMPRPTMQHRIAAAAYTTLRPQSFPAKRAPHMRATGTAATRVFALSTPTTKMIRSSERFVSNSPDSTKEACRICEFSCYLTNCH